MKRPVLLYDGGCRFCRFTARVAARFDRGRYAYLPFDDAEAAPLLARLPEARRYASAHLVRLDGSVWSPQQRALPAHRRQPPPVGRLVPARPGPRRYP